MLASDDAKQEFASQRTLSHEEAVARATAAAVVIGDLPEEATFDNLNRAFRSIRGATLVRMHRNPRWLTPDGPTLDFGSFVVGLEFAAETRARVIGKPSPAFFAQAVRDLRKEVVAISRGAISPWSATTSGPISGPPNVPAYAASSSCQGSTGRPISTWLLKSAAMLSDVKKPPHWSTSPPRALDTGNGS